MKKTILTLFVLLLGCSLVAWGGENLGELAKKEKARRKAIEKEGKQSKTFTNADIADLKATLAIEVTEEPEAEGETQAEEGISEPTTSESPEESTAPVDETYETTEEAGTSNDEVSQEDQEKIQSLKDEKAALEEEINQSRETLDTGGPMVRNIGSQMRQSREAEDRISEIDKEVKKLEEGEEGEEEPEPESE